MSERELTYADLMQIVQAFESSSEFSELHIKYGEIELDLRKHGAATDAAGTRTIAAGIPVPAAPLRAGGPPEANGPAKIDAARSAPAPEPVSAVAFPAGAHIVKSPMVGMFYRAPEPGATPFVKVGQRIAADATVCIIEVMKLMNSIRAGSSGVVTHVLVTDGEAVEFGQSLVVIDPGA